MPFESTDALRVEYIDGRKWLLLEDFGYFDDDFFPNGIFICVPRGFITDFASVPRILWNILPPTGEYGKAAVIHDYLYVTGKVGEVRVTKAYADGVFCDAMADLSVGRTRRTLMWLAVKVGGGRAWNRYRAADPHGLFRDITAPTHASTEESKQNQ